MSASFPPDSLSESIIRDEEANELLVNSPASANVPEPRQKQTHKRRILGQNQNIRLLTMAEKITASLARSEPNPIHSLSEYDAYGILISRKIQKLSKINQSMVQFEINQLIMRKELEEAGVEIVESNV